MSGTESLPMLSEIDHVAVAVRDLEAAIRFYRDCFGASVVHREVMEYDGVEEALVAVGGSFVQLLCPIRSDSTVAVFLAKRGEGLHHVAFRVDDCLQALQEARKAGADPVDEVPRSGSRNTKVAFLHPRGAYGTLIELVQLAPEVESA